MKYQFGEVIKVHDEDEPVFKRFPLHKKAKRRKKAKNHQILYTLGGVLEMHNTSPIISSPSRRKRRK